MKPGRGGGFPPDPPQTCASGFPAHRSSSAGFAPLRYPPLFRELDFRPRCVFHVSSRRSRNRLCPFPTPRLWATAVRRLSNNTVSRLRLPSGFAVLYLCRLTPILELLPLFAPPRRKLTAQRPAPFLHIRWRPLRYSSQDLDESLMFPRNPLAPLSCCLTPVGSTSLTLSGFGCYPPPLTTQAPAYLYSEAQSHGLDADCLVFVVPLLTIAQNSFRAGG